MTDRSALTELASFVARSPLASSDPASRDRHQGKGSKPGATLVLFPVPADREGEGISDRKRREMGKDVEGVGAEKLFHGLEKSRARQRMHELTSGAISA